jgi:hypothetical protein
MKKPRTNEAIAASSATYRKNAGQVADAIGVEMEESTGRPSVDFAKIVAQINNLGMVGDDNAQQYYRLGVRRGLRIATSLMADGHFYTDDKGCRVKENTTFALKFKAPSGKRKTLKFKFTPEDLGFID